MSRRRIGAVRVALSAANLAGFVLCLVGAPWDDITWALATVALSFIPFAVLQYLIIRVAHDARGCNERIEAERRLAEQLPPMRERIVEAIRGAGGEGRPPRASSVLGARAAATATGTALDLLQQRFAAREETRSDALSEALHEFSLNQVEPLQRDHEKALAAGLGGTVLGLLIQVFIAQRLGGGGVLGGVFLTGIVLKAGATVVGLVVALWARSLRWRLLEAWDVVRAEIIRFIALDLAPALRLDNPVVIEITGAFREMLDEFGRKIGGLGDSVSAALNTAVANAATTIKEDVANGAREEMKAAVQAEIGPLVRDCRELNGSIVEASAALAQCVDTLGASSEALRRDLVGATNAPAALRRELDGAAGNINALKESFGEIASEAGKTAAAVSKCSQEMLAAVRSLQESGAQRPGDATVDGATSKLARDLLAASESLRHALGNYTAAYSELAGRLDSAGRKSRDRGGSVQ